MKLSRPDQTGLPETMPCKRCGCVPEKAVIDDLDVEWYWCDLCEDYSLSPWNLAMAAFQKEHDDPVNPVYRVDNEGLLELIALGETKEFSQGDIS